MPRILLSVLALAFAVDAASADIPPPPGSRERAYAKQIRDAGFACAEPATFTFVEGERAKELDAKGLRGARVACKGGKSYLVANPPPWRNFREPPPADRPTPVIEPMR